MMIEILHIFLSLLGGVMRAGYHFVGISSHIIFTGGEGMTDLGVPGVFLLCFSALLCSAMEKQKLKLPWPMK